MPPVVIDRSIPYGAMRLLVARTPDGRTCLGLYSGPAARSPIVFLEVALPAVDALERGELSLYALLATRGPGRVLEVRAADLCVAMV
jgi:hypothetical protein